jgi:hypothetical protein
MYFLQVLILFLCALSYAQEPPPAEQKSDADKRKDLLGEVQVSRVHSIDEVKGTYKSPRKAMFMSLILPGSGQLYVGTKQSRYVRGVFYLAEEIALISGLYYHSIYKYDKKAKEYQNFAKTHFSINKYEKAMNDLYRPEYEEAFNVLYRDPIRDTYCKAFYGTSGSDKCVENFGQNHGNYPGDNTPFYNSGEYYRAITNENLVLGWDDAVPNEYVETHLYNLEFSDYEVTYESLGQSSNQEEYLSMRKKANDLADRQVIFLGALILNHIVSAVDAALSAKAHNNSLYEEKISFLDKIRLNSRFSTGENFKAEAAMVYLF